VTLSIVIITYNEEANIDQTLKSVAPLLHGAAGEVIIVDSGSTDRTLEIARSHGTKVFLEPWKGYAAQKNSAIQKASGEWILSLDADEELSDGLSDEISGVLQMSQPATPEAARRLRTPEGYWIPRKNYFLGRWIKHGGFWPDPKLRLFRRGAAQFENRLVHEDVRLAGTAGKLRHALVHHSYATLADYIDHMNRYSSLGAEAATANGRFGFSLLNIVLRPLATFIYNYFFRLGFLDGHEGLLLQLYHAVYVSWKYAKAWEREKSVKVTQPSIN
jgi:glycosyltransferase involved in cell wall biosynthesis